MENTVEDEKEMGIYKPTYSEINKIHKEQDVRFALVLICIINGGVLALIMLGIKLIFFKGCW